jgi:PAS domain S-box-containing protein
MDDTGAPEDVYRRLVNATTDHALFMLDTDGTVTTWPPAAQRLYGYRPADAIDRSLDAFFATDRATTPPVADLLEEARTGSVDADNWHRRQDGSVFWASCTVSPVSNGTLDGYAVVVRNTTHRTRYERRLEHQNDRLKEFTDIVSHDLRAPLSIINGRLELFYETGDEEHLAAIDRTTDRMNRLVDDLLQMARQGQRVKDPEPTRIGTVIDIAQEGALPASVTLETEPMPPVLADADRLIQLFENLFRNSTEQGGNEVTVRVGRLPDGLYVEDDGPGIPKEHRSRVFDHGYTTRPNGTGYGLSVVRAIVNAHGWDVVVVDGTDGGARFELTGIEFGPEH